MDESLLTIFVVCIISFVVFLIIKAVCKPIKNITAILLVIPTITTCGIALLIYKSFTNIHAGYGSKYSSSTKNNTYDDNYFNDDDNNSSKKTAKKKPARSHTDAFGKTTFFDENGDYMGEGITDKFGKTIYTNETGDYAGESFNNGHGQTIYTDKDGNIITGNSNYLGDETFSDGTYSQKDSSGNKNYS